MFSVFFGVFMRGRADVVKNSVSGVFSVFKKGKMVFRAQHTTNTENHQNTPEIEYWCFMVDYRHLCGNCGSRISTSRRPSGRARGPLGALRGEGVGRSTYNFLTQRA